MIGQPELDEAANLRLVLVHEGSDGGLVTGPNTAELFEELGGLVHGRNPGRKRGRASFPYSTAVARASNRFTSESDHELGSVPETSEIFEPSGQNHNFLSTDSVRSAGRLR